MCLGAASSSLFTIENKWLGMGMLEVSCQAIQHLEDDETHGNTQSLYVLVVERTGN